MHRTQLLSDNNLADLGGPDLKSVAQLSRLEIILDWLHITFMADDVRKLSDHLTKMSEKVLAWIHERRPDLQGKSLEETIATLREEDRLTRSQSRK
jgi:hypothetical protein